MFNRDNAIGFLLLGVCAVVAGYLVYAIATGERLRLQVNGTVGTVLTLLFFGLIIYGMVSSGVFRRFRGGSSEQGRQWPDPQAGRSRKSLWDRLRGR